MKTGRKPVRLVLAWFEFRILKFPNFPDDHLQAYVALVTTLQDKKYRSSMTEVSLHGRIKFIPTPPAFHIVKNHGLNVERRFSGRGPF